MDLAKQQQVTSYAHKDENNVFLIKMWNEEPPNNTDPHAIVDLIKNGDLVRLEHVTSRRNIHSHREPAPVSKRHFQVELFALQRSSLTSNLNLLNKPSGVHK